jgi:hypothetical protein
MCFYFPSAFRVKLEVNGGSWNWALAKKIKRQKMKKFRDCGCKSLCSRNRYVTMQGNFVWTQDLEVCSARELVYKAS